MAFSQTYTERSNARRAAKSKGVSPDLVVACQGGFRFPLPDDNADGMKIPAALDQRNPEVAAKAKKARETYKPPVVKAEPTQQRLQLSGGKGKRGKKAMPQGESHRARIHRMITESLGATMPELVKATGLKEHTIRARISELAAEHKLTVKRERLLGVTTYKAKKSK